jgi:hypothetical protein
VSAAREAIVLPLIFLTVAMFGGLQPGVSLGWTPPSLFSLVLAVMLVAVLVRSGGLAPERLMHGRRGALANANGFIVLVSLVAGSAQALHMLTPRSGLPSLFISVLLFLLLLNTLVSSPARGRVLQSLVVVLGSTFVLKFVVLASLADPAGSRTARVLVALFDAATLGTISQEPLPATAGYVAFVLVGLLFIGLAALPARRTDWLVHGGAPTGLVERSR